METEITDSFVNEFLQFHIKKWEEYEQLYGHTLAYNEWRGVRNHWHDWSVGVTTPEETFGRKDHPYVGWTKAQFVRLTQAADKWYVAFKARHESSSIEKRIAIQWRWAFQTKNK